MNLLKNQLVLIFFLLIPIVGFSQKSNKIQEVTVQSSIQCNECVDRLENMFAEYWAVKEVDYNIEEQTITVRYNSKKTSVDDIKEKISGAGYDADDVEAQIDAYLTLPQCCKKGNEDYHKKD